MRLPTDEWEQRHRWILRLVWLHIPVIVVFGFARHFGAVHNLLEGLPTAVMGAIAVQTGLSRRARSMAAGLGLMASSAVLVHMSGGVTEMHFHFFVMLAVISLYQDWAPYLVSIAFVAAHHGVVGWYHPEDVFSTPAAWRSPLLWAGIHAFFVLCSAAVSVATWGIVEAGHRRSRAALEASEHRFRGLIEHSSDVVTVIDADGVITYDSPSSHAVLGYPLTERIGANGFDFVHDDDRERALEIVARTVAGGTATNVEVRVRHHDGSYRWVEASITNLLDEPSIAGVVANFRDITERKVLEDELAHQAFHDPLTGLANRALLLDRANHALARTRRGTNTTLALLYLDLDDFKTVNDALGHEAGDQLLVEVARRLRGCLRPGDTASRLGGDEFAVLLENLPGRDDAYETGARILEALQATFDADGEQVSVTASVGIAIAIQEEDATELMRNADLAMYRAKGQGKGRFEIYAAGMHEVVKTRMALKADMRRAVDADEFVNHYQPIFDLASGRFTGVEALVRWHHPQRGTVSPAEFIPMAEETGLIVTIGSRVLWQACLDAAGWRREFGPDAPQSVSVNLSPRQLQDSGLITDVRLALSSAGLPASALILEITESVLLDDTDGAADTLAQLKALGVRIALDDFGTGYSSLTYLDRFPVDVLKIDKSFVDALGTDDTERSPLVAAIVNLGMMLGLHVTAEGIEGAEQLALLRSMGCELGQGFYFAEPMSDADLCASIVRAKEQPQLVMQR